MPKRRGFGPPRDPVVWVCFARYRFYKTKRSAFCSNHPAFPCGWKRFVEAEEPT